MSEVAELRAYGRAMYERAVVAEHDCALLQDRLNELAAQNIALRAEHNLPQAHRCVVCTVPTGGAGLVCVPCRRYVTGDLVDSKPVDAP